MYCEENNDNIPESSVRINDDTRSFGRHFIKVNAPKGIEPGLISKCEFQCGDYFHEEVNPIFPYYIDPSAEDTAKLKKENYCYLKIYDSENNGITLEGTLKLIGKKQVVFGNTTKQKESTCSCDSKEPNKTQGRVRF